MKVFISWSGTRSEELAKYLREWLPLVLHYVEPWLSHSDIQAGERWSLEVAKELENCNFGILCVTRENLSSPWLLFEAGALAKSMQDGRVIPLLLDLDFKEISGPIAQFQAKKTDESGVKELLSSLNKANNAPIPDARLENLFSALWKQLEEQINSIPKAEISAKNARTQGDILEELVSSVRNVEVRIRDVADGDYPMRKSRRTRHQQMFVEGMIFESSDGPSDPLNLLLVASLFRDDAPWLYELGKEAYHALQSNQREKAFKAIKKFAEALDMSMRGPFLDDISRMPVQFIRHEFIEKYLNSFVLTETKTSLSPARRHMATKKLPNESSF